MKALGKRVLPFAKPSLWLALMIYVSAMAVPIFGDLEGRVWPVVTDLEIRSVSHGADGATLHGIMHKRRDCLYAGMTIYAGTHDNPNLPRERLQGAFANQPEELPTTRLPGLRVWGPWVIRQPARVTGPDLWIETRHRCHALWETQTLALRVAAPAVFGDVNASAAGPRADRPR